ncbi:hypothetical protein [Mucilaginibacter sp.]
MKKIFLTIATIGLLGTSVYAADGGKKTEKTATASYAVQNDFEGNFSDATNVTWAITSNTQKATFLLNGVKMTAFYNMNGDYLGLTQEVAYSIIGEKAKKEIAAQYTGYDVNEVIKLETNNVNTNFAETVYFVDLKSSAAEVLVRVNQNNDVYFFQKVK